MSQSQSLLQELEREAATTRRVLERVPEAKLTWRPHAKSMSLGQLASHTAGTPGQIAQLAQIDIFDAQNADFSAPQPANLQEVLESHETSISAARDYLTNLTDSAATATWALTSNGKQLMAMPRVEFLRTVMFNHWYHHRGQLSVYLRLLDIPVPVIYGRSADENPFA